jgi:PPK2 family polyphosphate:nucleotide phosphotransferase
MVDASRYRITPGTRVDLSTYDPEDKSEFDEGKKQGKAALPGIVKEMAELQRRLWAESSRSLLVVLQALDTGGKDGTIRDVFGGVNPQGVHIRGFGTPTEWELGHDFLWRVHQHTPEDGAITVFNRSHYEDVLVVRVKELAPAAVWSRRYEHIRAFERLLADEGTTIVKIYLNISSEEQRRRLQKRLDRPDKRWKFHEDDLEDRKLGDAYIEAYEDAISETAADHAPWYVIPGNRKWYRNLVVASLVVDTLRRMDPHYPDPEENLDGIEIT